MDITISPGACSSDVMLLWDTIWNPAEQQGDWALAASDEIANRGGLQAKAGLATGVILSLFTDRACPTDHPLYKFCEGDPRGWWGDGILFDDEDGPMGSLFWLLERCVVKAQGFDAAQWAESFALDALVWMQADGVVAKIVAAAAIMTGNRGLVLAVALYGHDGQKAFDQSFDIYWQQVLAA